MTTRDLKNTENHGEKQMFGLLGGFFWVGKNQLDHGGLLWVSFSLQPNNHLPSFLIPHQ